MQREKLDAVYLQNANPHRHSYTIFTELQKWTKNYGFCIDNQLK